MENLTVYQNVPTWKVTCDFEGKKIFWLTEKEKNLYLQAINAGKRYAHFNRFVLSSNFVCIEESNELIREAEKNKGPQTNVPHWVTEMQKQKEAEIRRQIDERRKEIQAKN